MCDTGEGPGAIFVALPGESPGASVTVRLALGVTGADIMLDGCGLGAVGVVGMLLAGLGADDAQVG